MDPILQARVGRTAVSEICDFATRLRPYPAGIVIEMPIPLILYSANTWLAYMIAERFYSGEHYVWCTPYFDPRQLSPRSNAVPPTSSPSEIYHGLFEEVRRGDRHSSKIKENRIGILRGAAVKKDQGIITDKEAQDIAAILERAETRDFRPLIYVIPYAVVCGQLSEVPVPDRAHPLSVEYIIDRLHHDQFDVIELRI